MLKLAKTVYRNSRWYYIKFLSGGRINDIKQIDPCSLEFGQTPNSQFPPKRFYGGYQDGDWDRQVIPIESHALFKSYVMHFLEGKVWESTPLFQFALETIDKGIPFRDEYSDLKSLKRRFNKCDQLFAKIQQDGFKSNHQLYEEGKIENILDLMDEVTVNRARDGSFILNDGWHRFVTARLLNLPTIPVRLCAQHTNLLKIDN